MTKSAVTTLVLEGSNFYTSDYTANVLLGGVKSDSVTIDSAGKITATFAKGVPIVETAAVPTLEFSSTAKVTPTFAKKDYTESFSSAIVKAENE